MLLRELVEDLKSQCQTECNSHEKSYKLAIENRRADHVIEKYLISKYDFSYFTSRLNDILKQAED